MPKSSTVTLTNDAQLTAFLQRVKATPAGSTDEKLVVLGARTEELAQAKTFITQHWNTISKSWGGNIPRNERGLVMIQDKLHRAVKELSSRIDDLTILRVQEIAFGNRMVTATPGAHAGDGKTYVSFVNVGMGDCTLITTPTGRRIMVDCGSVALSDVTAVVPQGYAGNAIEKIAQGILSETFLGSASSTIDILLLTHKDKDHHNKLKKVLGQVTGIHVSYIYYGGANTLEEYTSSSGFLKLICTATGDTLRKVTLKETKEPRPAQGKKAHCLAQINGNAISSKAGSPGTFANEYLSANGEIVLYEEANFCLSILAANVDGAYHGGQWTVADSDVKTAKEEKANSTEWNMRSLVVCVRSFGRQVLICGDATAVTERFVLNHFSDVLNASDTLRIGHHGSETSSCAAFVGQLTNLRMAVASTGGQETVKYRLPKTSIMRLYSDKLGATKPPGVTNHHIYSFKNGAQQKAELLPPFDALTCPLYATGSNDTVELAFPEPPAS